MIESYSLNEQFDFIKNYIPQPFFIKKEDFINISIEGEEFYIKTNKNKYTFTAQSIKKLASGLGMKMTLLSTVAEDIEVLSLSLPIINKLFSCFADCFVFYADSEDALKIIDVNVNNQKGDEDTIYRFGPKPWEECNKEDLANFTCFAMFKNTYDIDDSFDIHVKADDIMTSKTNVSLKLFKNSYEDKDDKDNKDKNIIEFTTVQPMLVFNSKFSNMNGFANIKPVLYDVYNDLYIAYPLNYRDNGKDDSQSSFESMWKELLKVYFHYDENAFIYDEIQELNNSNETPANVKSFINKISEETPINTNQPVCLFIAEAKSFASNLKPKAAEKFLAQIGDLIGRCFLAKHYGCHECGHLKV